VERQQVSPLRCCERFQSRLLSRFSRATVGVGFFVEQTAHMTRVNPTQFALVVGKRQRANVVLLQNVSHAAVQKGLPHKLPNVRRLFRQPCLEARKLVVAELIV
jgi:hypothetical protein